MAHHEIGHDGGVLSRNGLRLVVAQNSTGYQHHGRRAKNEMRWKVRWFTRREDAGKLDRVRGGAGESGAQRRRKSRDRSFSGSVAKYGKESVFTSVANLTHIESYKNK